jgi:hypothetical protein
MPRNKPDRRRAFPPYPTLAPTIQYSAETPSANVVRCTFTSPVQITGIPGLRYFTTGGVAGAAPTAVNQSSSTVLDFTFAANVNAASIFTYFADNDEAIRGVSGGFVSSVPRYIDNT